MKRDALRAGQESVWDYPRPPCLERVSELIRVELAGEEIARTVGAFRVLETSHPPGYYIPPDDVRCDWMHREPHRSICEWKGVAEYWSVRIGAKSAPRAAWSYPDPAAPFRSIRDYFAFYPARVDACFVAGERVRAQPGGFYGGWITASIAGPFKGEPGTEGW